MSNIDNGLLDMSHIAGLGMANGMYLQTQGHLEKFQGPTFCQKVEIWLKKSAPNPILALLLKFTL